MFSTVSKLRQGRFTVVIHSDDTRTLEIHGFERSPKLAWGLIGRNAKSELRELCAALNGGTALPKYLTEAKLRLRFWELAKGDEVSREAKAEVLRRLTPTLMPRPAPGQRAKRGKATRASDVELKKWCLAQLELHGLDTTGLHTRGDAQAALVEGFLRNAHRALSAAHLDAMIDHVVKFHAKAAARAAARVQEQPRCAEAQAQQQEHQQFLARIPAGDYAGLLAEDPPKFVAHWKKTEGQAFTGDTLLVALPDKVATRWAGDDASRTLRDVARAADALGVHQAQVLSAHCSATVVLARHAAALPAGVRTAEAAAAERGERRRQMQEAAARRRQEERRRWEEIERKEDLAREEHARRRKASVQAQTLWDVRGKWELECEEAKQYGDDCGKSTLVIVGDGRGKLMGELKLTPVEGVMKLRRRTVSPPSRCVRFKWGGRESGEGEMSLGEDQRGDIVFEADGRFFRGWIDGGYYNCADLSGRLIEAHATFARPAGARGAALRVQAF